MMAEDHSYKTHQHPILQILKDMWLILAFVLSLWNMLRFSAAVLSSGLPAEYYNDTRIVYLFTRVRDFVKTKCFIELRYRVAKHLWLLFGTRGILVNCTIDTWVRNMSNGIKFHLY